MYNTKSQHKKKVYSSLTVEIKVWHYATMMLLCPESVKEKDYFSEVKR